MPNRHPSSPVAPSAAATAAARDLPPRVHGLLERLLGMVSSEMRRALDRMLVTMEIELEQHARMARNPALQAGHMAMLGALQRQRERFVPTYLRGLEQAVFGIRQPSTDTSPGVPTTRPEDLRLVDHGEVGEDAILDTIADRLEGRARLPLLLLGQRFGVLAGAPAFAARSLPVGPHRLAGLLTNAAEAVGLERESRTQLYRIFERQFIDDYAGLVESMNALLERENVLPGLTFVPLRRPRRRVEETTSADPAASDTDAATRTGGFTGWLGQTVPMRERPKAEAGPDFALLRELLAARRSQASSGEPLPSEPRVSLDTGEVDAALGTLQARSSTTPAAHGVSEIRQALLAQSRLRLGQPAALSPEDNDTFDLVGLLHSGIGRELRPDSPSRMLVDRLQVPLLRVALHDHDFFLKPRHPARELLNAVAEPGARWLADDEVDPQLTTHMEQAVDHVVRHYDGDAAVFDTANRKLQQQIKRTSQKAEISERRHVEAARGREKLALAKQEAQALVDRAVGDSPAPRFLRNLLDQAWGDVLTLVLLRHGAESPEWTAHVADTSRIVAASLHGDLATPELTGRVSHALSLVGYHGAEAQAITRRLTGAPELDDDAASRTELAMKLKARSRLGSDATEPQAATLPRTPREQEFYDHLCTLPFGTWIEFPVNERGEVVRRRLAWYSPRTGHALFVNQRGQRIEDGSAPQNLDPVARLFAAGTAHVVTADRGGLVDRAWQATLSMLRGLGPGRTGTGEVR